MFDQFRPRSVVFPYPGSMAVTDRYDEWLISGRPIFLLEGLDYTQPIEWVRQNLRSAAKRRNMKVATRELLDPPGLLFQGYIGKRPRLSHLTVQSRISKKSHKYLFCLQEGCDTRLRPDSDLRVCEIHAD